MKRKLMTGAVAAALLSGVPVAGDTAEPAVNSVLVSVQDGQHKRFVYELEATAYILFIPVTGKATFNTELLGDTYKIAGRVKTTGIADVFVDYDMRIAASGYVEDDGLRTYNYISQNNDGKKNRRVEMTYGSNDVNMVARPRFGNLGEPPATPDQKLAARDPMSALINAAFTPRTTENPCGDTIKSFDGRQLTHLSFEYQKEVNIKTKAYRGKAWECVVTLDRVAGFKKGDRGKNLDGIDGPMKIYFAEVFDDIVAPVKVVVDTEDIGKITLQTSKLRLEDITTQQARVDSRAG